MHDVERMTADATGEPVKIFSDIDPDYWLESCRKVPSQLTDLHASATQ